MMDYQAADVFCPTVKDKGRGCAGERKMERSQNAIFYLELEERIEREFGKKI